MINKTDDILGIDYGAKRIGIARISPVARIAEPLTTIDATDSTVYDQIQDIMQQYSTQACVVGLPRGLDGQDTEQTVICRQFASKLQENLGVSVYLIDEAGSSQEARQRIHDTGDQTGIDAVAAAVFVEDFINFPNPEQLLVAN